MGLIHVGLTVGNDFGEQVPVLLDQLLLRLDLPTLSLFG